MDKPDVLVLKFKFNTAWNYFNATELCNNILGYWQEWIEHADKHHFNAEFPLFNQTLGNVNPRLEHMLFVDEGSIGSFVPGVWTINILNR